MKQLTDTIKEAKRLGIDTAIYVFYSWANQALQEQDKEITKFTLAIINAETLQVTFYYNDKETGEDTPLVELFDIKGDRMGRYSGSVKGLKQLGLKAVS